MSLTRPLARLYCRRPSAAEGSALKRAATWAVQAAALLVLTTLLAGCHRTQVVWAKPGGDSAALHNDMQTCNYHPLASTPFQSSPPQPTYQPMQTLFGGQPVVNPSSYRANSMAPANSNESTKSVPLDLQNEQRSPVSCMIAHGWRLTPLP